MREQIRTRALEVLTEARSILSVKENWTKGVMARDRDFEAVGIKSPYACSFCVLGALRRASHNLNPVGLGGDAMVAMDYLELATGEDIPDWNDDPNTTHDDVLKAFDKAIELVKMGKTT